MIVHRNGETSVRDSLSAVEKALGSREFIVADRGYLANIRHVMKMKSRELYMRNGNIITVGRERFKHVRKAIFRLLEGDLKYVDGIIIWGGNVYGNWGWGVDVW